MIKLLYFLWQLKRAEKFSKKKILRLQHKRLVKIVKHAIKNSKFYREQYKKAGITLKNVNNLKIKDLPVIDKKIMMENFDDLICVKGVKRKDLEKFIAKNPETEKIYKGKYRIIHSSGSSGKIGIYVYDNRAWTILKALAMSRVTKTKINFFKKHRLAFIGAMGGHYAGISLAASAPRFLFKTLTVNINSPLQEIIKKVDKFKPDTITGYSSGAYILAEEQLKGNINIKPKRILCSGDALTPMMAKKITEAFGVKPTNYYASSESVCMAAQCEEHKDLHLFNDWHVFEIEKEMLILSNLYNFAQPLIRYRMNDDLMPDNKPCKCGWPFPVIRIIAGRSEEFLWFEKKNGEKDFLHPCTLVEFFVEGLEKFQFIQTEKNTIKINAVIFGKKDSVIKAMRSRMNEILRAKKLQNTVKIDIAIVKDIKNDEKTGKFKLIVPLNA